MGQRIPLTGLRRVCTPILRDHRDNFLLEELPSYRLPDRKVQMERIRQEPFPPTIGTGR